MKSIYIATEVAGKGITDITEYSSLDDYHNYACQILCTHNDQPTNRETISSLNDLLADNGIGQGSRRHYRISRKDAAEVLKNRSVNNNTLRLN